MDQEESTQLWLTLPIGCLYVVLGVVGLLFNLLTMLMILTKRVYRLSAYTIMANVALADALVLIVAGIGCGVSVILYSSSSHQSQEETSATLALLRASIKSMQSADLRIKNKLVLSIVGENFAEQEELPWESYFGSLQITPTTIRRKKRFSLVPTPEEFLNVSILLTNSSASSHKVSASKICLDFIHSSMAFIEISAWTAGVVSYAFLGINRCVAICFYGTKAKAFNRVSIAVISSVFTWLIGIITVVFISISLLIHCLSVTIQWICSSLVLMKIHQVKKKISKNKLNQNSANRFRKQARLTFQFFYPSLFCTISSILYFAKPFVSRLLSDYHFIILHIIWLSNHFCNPFIYIYFNERMRHSYWELLSCAQLRFLVLRSKGQNDFKNRINVSRRSAGQHSLNQRQSRQSVRSAGSRSNGHFVRNSLQMQSRDFEQLCEFMMRVNPLYESSEGWRESSSDLVNEMENYQAINGKYAFETRSEVFTASGHKRSVVGELGRETLEHWAAFAKKASI